MKTIRIGAKGNTSVIDEEDYIKVSKYNWQYNKGYGICKINGKTVSLHRFILDLEDPNIHVDHINGDTLDNRKSNLRICTRRENSFNVRKRDNGTSKYKGVSWHETLQMWRARISADYKLISLGCFHTQEEAGKAYDKKAVELHGEFARLNFPELKEEYLKFL